ncbi:MAG TPA: hypothetical protein PKB09_01810 [Candidatus Saccharibacteria bacterium]|nr:hypothetical protein [Candidatus Saccharibacteria bacterium]
MNTESNQLESYVNQQFDQGISESEVRQNLLQKGWDKITVDKAIEYAVDSRQSKKSSHNSKVKNGIFWILSPFIFLLIVIILNIISRFSGIDSTIIDVISLMAGITGIILIFVGPIIGILKLSKHN